MQVQAQEILQYINSEWGYNWVVIELYMVFNICVHVCVHSAPLGLVIGSIENKKRKMKIEIKPMPLLYDEHPATSSFISFQKLLWLSCFELDK